MTCLSTPLDYRAIEMNQSVARLSFSSLARRRQFFRACKTRRRLIQNTSATSFVAQAFLDGSKYRAPARAN
jgi:hypothetical protein